MEFRELCLTFTTSVILLSAKLGGGTSSNESRDATLRRWLHGCHMMFPCPPPPCDNPVYGQGDCCGHCPEPEPVPTPEKTLIKRPDESGANGTTALIEKNRRSLDLHGSSKELFKRLIYMTTPPFTRTTLSWTTPDCPYPCTHQGVHYCHPLPCYINCVDAVKPPGGCCYVCGNGPNCGYNGQVIPEGKFITGPSGEEIHCIRGAYDGGSVEIRHPTSPSVAAKI